MRTTADVGNSAVEACRCGEQILNRVSTTPFVRSVRVCAQVAQRFADSVNMSQPATRAHSLRWRLLIPTLLLVNGALFAVYQVATSTSSSALRDEVGTNLAKSSENLADSLTQTVEDTRADAVSAAALDMPAEAIESGDAKNIVLYANQMVRSKGRYATIFVTDDLGEVVAANSIDKDGKELANLEGKTLGELAWLKQVIAAEKGTAVWIAPSRPEFLAERLPASERVFGFALPIVDLMDSTIGAMGVLVPASYLGTVLEGFAPGGGGLSSFAALVDASGAPLAMPSSLMVDPSWNTFAVGGSLKSVAAPNGADYVGKSAELTGSITREGWRAVVFKTKSSLEAPITAMSNKLMMVAVAAVFLTMFVLIFITSRILAPIRGLTKATTGVDRPSDYEPVEIVVNDEVGILTHSFNTMIAKLEEFQHGLEDKVQERTKALGSRNRDMRRVFENVDQGFIMLDKEGVMALERSAVVDMWFGSYSEPQGFADYIRQTDDSFAAHFEMSWESLADGFMPLALCLEQLPSQLRVVDSIYSLHYSPLKNEGDAEDEEAWEGLLLVIADISHQVALERAQAAQQELGNAIKAIMKDRQGYIMFHNDTGRLVQEVVSGAQDTDLPLLKRSVHTIKGNSGIYGFQSIAEHCHQMEDEMVETGALPTEAAKKELAGHWARLDESIQFILGNDADEEISVSAESYQDLLGRLHALGGDIFQEVFAWQLEPLEVALGRLAQRTRQIAKRMGMPDVNVVVETEQLSVDPEYWGAFWGELVHVLRNSLDHGLSPMEGRGSTIRLSGSTKEQEFVFEISDNGVGVNWERVAEKAKAIGIPSETHEELVEALFHSGLSTCEEATQMSGRGLGMCAVRQKVLAMGGRIEAQSTPGKGTTFTFSFPERILFGDLYESTCEALGQGQGQEGAQSVYRALEARRSSEGELL
ncbi:MAG: HAMP domain-containing protein [Myxococcales bacterium]|nr:HAMP domain-containing protein [Myxococcales bacterium]